MRSRYVDRATVILGALLVSSVMFFAWMRSHAVTLVVVADGVGASRSEEGWRSLGRELYGARCSGCHPRLTHVPELLAAEGARAYLVDFMLYGFDGEAVIGGAEHALTHPAFDDLSDAELAAALNHVRVAWGNEERLAAGLEPYGPEEIESARGRGLDPETVARQRPTP